MHPTLLRTVPGASTSQLYASTSGSRIPCPAAPMSRSRRLIPPRAITEQQPASSDPAPAGTRKQDPDVLFDFDWFHYTPKWYKPQTVVLAGASFIIGCNLASEPGLKTTVLAGIPTLFFFWMFLWMVPRQFRDYARAWVSTHPECEAKERERARERARVAAADKDAKDAQQH
uniref:Uncharacterized protein n=1 Tax=Chlamydomonas leiostraca TaxID=1034604 RepID=A0A7S0S551_9CHLO|mmetsp:Transcript_7536/g.18686  ORF Transcript_7536/g.18686 Transcript_7536/m.18686 type:complete len:172 (+) Transcript_7536:182-697(+)